MLLHTLVLPGLEMNAARSNRMRASTQSVGVAFAFHPDLCGRSWNFRRSSAAYAGWAV